METRRLEGPNPFETDADRENRNALIDGIKAKREDALEKLKSYAYRMLTPEEGREGHRLMDDIRGMEAELRALEYERSGRPKTLSGRFAEGEAEAYGYVCTYTTAGGMCGNPATHCEGMRIRCDAHPPSKESPIKCF